MKSLLFIAAILLSSMVAGGTQGSEQVYICTGPKSYTYHKKPTCRGLNRCSGTIKKVTVTEAQKQHRRACKICFK